MSPSSKTPYEAFKPIRNLLRKYDSVSLARQAAAELHQIETKPIEEWHGRLPWYLLLLIKWGFEFGGSEFPPREVAESDLVTLVNKLHDFEGDCGSPFLGGGGLPGLSKFLRTTAFQQFWLHRSQAAWDFARQRVLFCHLPPEHPLQAQFTQRFGLTMDDFIEIALLVWAWLAKTPANIQFNPERLLANFNVPAGKKAAFIAALSLQSKGVAQFLRARPQAVKNPCFQLREPSPLDQYPFLALEGQQLVYSRRLFERTTRHFFYDQAKLLGESKGAELVAQILEQYVDQSLLSAGLPFYTESDLKHAFPSRKVTDFLVPCNDFTLLVEVKATEMRPSVIVFPANQQLENELRDSVIKAAVQGYSLANDLPISSAGLDIPNRSDFFLFILTYRDMYLGPGQLLWDEFLAAAVQTDLEDADIDPQVIPPERIVVLSLEEWDILMSILHSDRTLLSHILKDMVLSNRDSATAKFAFGQHLDASVPAQPELPYLDEEFTALCTSMEAKLL